MRWNVSPSSCVPSRVSNQADTLDSCFSWVPWCMTRKTLNSSAKLLESVGTNADTTWFSSDARRASAQARAARYRTGSGLTMIRHGVPSPQSSVSSNARKPCFS